MSIVNQLESTFAELEKLAQEHDAAGQAARKKRDDAEWDYQNGQAKGIRDTLATIKAKLKTLS